MTTLSEIEARMKACADELEAEINARASGELPRRIKRDLATVEEARAAIASVVPLARRAMEMEWRTIDSAPRGGTHVIIARDMGPPWGWVRGVGYHVSGGKYVNIEGWVPICGASEHPGVLGLGHPTHWCALPSPPTSTEEKENRECQRH